MGIKKAPIAFRAIGVVPLFSKLFLLHPQFRAADQLLVFA
jgi:hypothetical protein